MLVKDDDVMTSQDDIEFLPIWQFWVYYDVIDREQKKLESIMMSPRNTSSTKKIGNN